MKEIMSDPTQSYVIDDMQPLKDPRWEGWRKVQYNRKFTGIDGKIQSVTIHFNGKFTDGKPEAVDDFKFVD